MRKIYDEYFHIPKEGRIREKVMTARVAVMMLLIVVYLLSMSMTAYAYYTCSVSSAGNTIKSANFDIDIKVVDSAGANVTLKETDNGYELDLSSNMKYTITLKLKKESTAETGFCVITFRNNTYHTQQLGKDISAGGEMTTTTPLTFTVGSSSKEDEILFSPHWGTSYMGDDSEYEQYYVEDGEHIGDVVDESSMIINGEDDSSTKSEDTEKTAATTESNTEVEEKSTSQSTESGTQIPDSTAQESGTQTPDSTAQESGTQTPDSTAQDSGIQTTDQTQESCEDEKSQSNDEEE